MAKIVHGLTSAIVALAAVACGSGDITPNGVEPIDCTQDDAFVVQTVGTNTWNFASQDQTFRVKRTRESGEIFSGEGAYVGEVKLPQARCAPEGDDLAVRLWTVSQYTRWGQGITVPGTTSVDPAALGYEGISFWAKALVDTPTDNLVFTESKFLEPKLKPDPTKSAEDMPNTLPETPADFAARLPQPVTSTAILRISIATRDTQVRSDDPNIVSCVDPGLMTPPPLQVQDGSDECYDAFSVAVYPPSHWKFYTIPFAELRQTGWGKPVNFLDSGHITEIQITIGPFADYDFLMDNFGFYKHIAQ